MFTSDSIRNTLTARLCRATVNLTRLDAARGQLQTLGITQAEICPVDAINGLMNQYLDELARALSDAHRGETQYELERGNLLYGDRHRSHDGFELEYGKLRHRLLQGQISFGSACAALLAGFNFDDWALHFEEEGGALYRRALGYHAELIGEQADLIRHHGKHELPVRQGRVVLSFDTARSRITPQRYDTDPSGRWRRLAANLAVAEAHMSSAGFSNAMERLAAAYELQYHHHSTFDSRTKHDLGAGVTAISFKERVDVLVPLAQLDPILAYLAAYHPQRDTTHIATVDAKEAA